jgi:O6-methylguanine-DNA--protein-cysteine methyltransferase
MVVYFQEDAFIGEVRESPGPLTFAVDAEGRLLWLQFLDGDYPNDIAREIERRGFQPRGDAGQGDRVRQEILEYCHGQRRAFSVPLRLIGTAWQQEVWHAVTRIPFGEKRTYGHVAG